MTGKNKVLFLICFAMLTFAPIPIFSLFREQIGYKNTENKAVADFPSISLSSYSTWPKRFEQWLSDTLPFKTQFIELFREFQLRTGSDYDQSDVIRGKDDWLFYRATVDNYKGLSRFSEEELETIGQNVSGFFSMMESKGSECLLYIAPDKEQVYAQYMPDSILRPSEESRGDQLSNWLGSRLQQPVLYPKVELIELSEKHPVYFVTDTHWNELGGYFAAEQVKSVFFGEPKTPSIPTYHYYNEQGKDLANMLGLSEMLPENNAVLIDFKDGIVVSKDQTLNHGQIQRFSSNASSGKKLMILGDSFSEYFLRSAIHDFSEILFVTYGELSQIDWEAENPDYLVVMLVERNLPFLLNGFY